MKKININKHTLLILAGIVLVVTAFIVLGITVFDVGKNRSRIVLKPDINRRGLIKKKKDKDRQKSSIPAISADTDKRKDKGKMKEQTELTDKDKEKALSTGNTESQLSEDLKGSALEKNIEANITAEKRIYKRNEMLVNELTLNNSDIMATKNDNKNNKNERKNPEALNAEAIYKSILDKEKQYKKQNNHDNNGAMKMLWKALDKQLFAKKNGGLLDKKKKSSTSNTAIYSNLDQRLFTYMQPYKYYRARVVTPISSGNRSSVLVLEGVSRIKGWKIIAKAVPNYTTLRFNTRIVRVVSPDGNVYDAAGEVFSIDETTGVATRIVHEEIPGVAMVAGLAGLSSGLDALREDTTETVVGLGGSAITSKNKSNNREREALLAAGSKAFNETSKLINKFAVKKLPVIYLDKDTPVFVMFYNKVKTAGNKNQETKEREGGK